jgi:hypothetical protein
MFKGNATFIYKYFAMTIAQVEKEISELADLFNHANQKLSDIQKKFAGKPAGKGKSATMVGKNLPSKNSY